MHAEIVIAGFGGQGVLFAGQLLAYAGMAEGRHVTWIPSYGPEMRGGTAHCTVIISDEEIGSPLVRHPQIALVLNPPSMEKYAPQVKPSGWLIVDSSLVVERSGRADIHEVDVPAKDMAAELGMPQAANVVMIGTLLAETGVAQVETVERILTERFAHKPDVAEANRQALRLGMEFAATVTV